MTAFSAYRNSKAESDRILAEQLALGGRDVFAVHTGSASPYPGAIENRECIRLLKFAATRRRMKKAHDEPTRKCWKECVFCERRS